MLSQGGIAQLRIACTAIMLLSTTLRSSSEACLASNSSTTNVGAANFADVNQSVINSVKRVSAILQVGEPNVYFYSELGSFYTRPACNNPAQLSDLLIDTVMSEELLSSGQVALDLVVAHEMSHVMQVQARPDVFCRNGNNSPSIAIMSLELAADLGAGYVIEALDPTADKNLQTNTLVRLSDYEFADPTHHGRVSDRTNAFNIGRYARSKGFHLDYKRILNDIDYFVSIVPGPRVDRIKTRADYDAYIANVERRLFR